MLFLSDELAHGTLRVKLNIQLGLTYFDLLKDLRVHRLVYLDEILVFHL